MVSGWKSLRRAAIAASLSRGRQGRMTVSEPRYTPLQRVRTRLKRGAKRGVLAGLTRLVSRSAEPTPNWEARKQKVPFLRHDRIGDMIVSSAVIRAIAQARGNIELHVLAS